MPEAVPLDFIEDDVTWVAPKLYGTAGALGSEAIELCNRLIRFECALEELWFIVTNMDDWMDNSSPPRAAYRALITYRLVVLDKRPGVRPMGIRETLRKAHAKRVMRAVGDQAKRVRGNLQMFAGLESVIEGETHAVRDRRR